MRFRQRYFCHTQGKLLFLSAQNVKIFSSEADTSTAKQAIAQSGIDSKELKLNILVNKNDNRTACAALLKNQLEAVGFTVTIDEVSTKEYARRVKGVEFNLYIGEVKLSDDMSLYPFFVYKRNIRHFLIKCKYEFAKVSLA